MDKKTLKLIKEGKLISVAERSVENYLKKYYYVDEKLSIKSASWKWKYDDVYLLINRNIFKTKKEASLYRNYKQRKFFLTRGFVYGNDNWYIYLDDKSGELRKGNNKEQNISGVDYFGKSEYIDMLLSEFVIDDIKKWEFNVWQ